MNATPRRVLLIEDERLDARLTEAHFENFRANAYELDWSPTYEEGLQRLLSGVYSVCLLDFQLGARDGLQLIREAVAKGCRTPIIFLTGETAERVDFEAMNAGALDYLVKDEITPRMLERSIRYAVKLGDTVEELRRLATRDQLTGLLNRREFDRILAEETDRARRFGHPFALIMVDLDHFKSVNDTHGHLVGDAVLREVAGRFGNQVRTVDRAARFGGEEFAFLMMETDRQAALEVTRRICEVVHREPVQAADNLEIPITISAGVAVLPGDATSAPELVAAADKALYTAKARGRNCVVTFSELRA